MRKLSFPSPFLMMLTGAFSLLAATAPAQPIAAPASPSSALAGDAKLAIGQPIPVVELQRFIDGVVGYGMGADHIAGVSVAVVQNGKVVVLKGYGQAEPGRPVDPARTLFRIGSISKTFTWIALMKEVERGRVRLDAPVNDYLPADLRIPDQGFRRPIRILDLMSHAPGFEDIAFGHLSVENSDLMVSPADYLRRHRPARVRAPGQFATYSNYGAALAGYIVARLEGADYDTVIEHEVLGPLGMTDTTFREPYLARPGLPAPMPADLASRVSSGFTWAGGTYRPAAFEFISQVAPAGGASTTAGDMARYMRLQLNDGTLDGVSLYGPQTARAFRTQILPVPVGFNGWAHGLMVRPLPGGLRGYGHGGAIESFYSNLVLVPELKLGVFATSNTNTGRALVERLPNLIVEHFYVPAAVAPTWPQAVITPAAGVYSGVYVTTRRAYFGLEKFVNLLDGTSEVSVTPTGRLTTRINGATRAWIPDGAKGRFRPVEGDDRIAFAFDASGRAVSYMGSRGNLLMERVGPALDPALFQAVAGLTLGVALLIWISAIARFGREASATAWQARVRRVSLGVGALWIVAIAAFHVAGLDQRPLPQLIFIWPGAAILSGSSAALLAALGSAALAVLTPLTWRAGTTDAPGWSLGGRIGHSLAAVLFVFFAVLVGCRGGLVPWT